MTLKFYKKHGGKHDGGATHLTQLRSILHSFVFCLAKSTATPLCPKDKFS
jgi:hypothetical protein